MEQLTRDSVSESEREEERAREYFKWQRVTSTERASERELETARSRYE